MRDEGAGGAGLEPHGVYDTPLLRVATPAAEVAGIADPLKVNGGSVGGVSSEKEGGL